MGSQGLATRQWSKRLDLHGPFEDNYVDATFLDSLVLETDSRLYTYSELVWKATIPVQHVCSYWILLAAWYSIHSGTWQPLPFGLVNVLLLAGSVCIRMKFCSATWWCSPFSICATTLRGNSWTVLLLSMWCILLRFWSEFTAGMLIGILLLARLVLWDQEAVMLPAVGDSGGGGGNAALPLKISILVVTGLSSRLPLIGQAVGFAGFAVLILLVLPQSLALLDRESCLTSRCVITPLLSLAAVYGFCWPSARGLLVGALLTLQFAAPALLLRLERSKLRIHGPWDIAHVEPFSVSSHTLDR